MTIQPKDRAGLWLQAASIILGIIGLVAYAASKFVSGKLVVVFTGVGILGALIALFFLAFHIKAWWAILKAIGLTLVSVIIGTYVILFIFVIFFQDAVANHTSSFFQPKTILAEAAQSYLSNDTTLIDLVTSDGIHLRGWMVRNSTAAKSPLVIYFGGSGSESSELIPLVKSLSGWSIALINYRGFGQSQGSPSQSTALSDALFIYDALSTQPDIDESRIVSMGYSLGTGVAVYLSAQRPTVGTILVSPYDYWTLIGVKQSPIFAPLKGLLKPYFNSIALAPAIKTPLLSLIGSDDPLINPELSLNLNNKWGGQVKAITYQGENHDLLFHHNTSWTDIADFLSNFH